MTELAIDIQSASTLLEDYQPSNSFFLAAPEHTIYAEWNPREIVNTEGLRTPASVNDVVQQALQAAANPYTLPMVVGAVPFDSNSAAHLVIPSNVRRAGPLSNNATFGPLHHEWTIQALPEAQRYGQIVADAVEQLQAGTLDKVVLSRSLQLTATQDIDIPALLRNLASHNPTAYRFALSLPDEKTLLGASPELLVSRHGSQVMAHPLAGSIPRSSDPLEDRARATQLLASTKNLHEHAVVIKAVATALRPYCRTLHVPEHPTLISTPTMWHLATLVEGMLSHPATSALELALALHPTPAVCGAPLAHARQAIQKLEPFDRGFFTGMLGWCDANGDGEWIVTIRCAEASKRSMQLFAGAGVVSTSQPADEIAETRAKFRTMLHALGIYQEVA